MTAESKPAKGVEMSIRWWLQDAFSRQAHAMARGDTEEIAHWTEKVNGYKKELAELLESEASLKS